MPPRNHRNWLKEPAVEYISSECYNNQDIHDQEQEQIFSKVWIPMCHKSELPNELDFRTTQIAGVNVIVYNTGKEFKAYRNYGSQTPAGTLGAPIVTVEPQLPLEVKHGGMIWVTLNPDPDQTVEQWLSLIHI